MNANQPPEPIVLIIDDEQTNLGIMIDTLESFGFTTITARNGTMGIKRAQFAQPDLILLDVMMPGIDGFETCRRLKADEQTCHIPVIFMTALADMQHKLQGFEIGGVDYITKPFEEQEVLVRVNTHLTLRRSQASLEQEIAERKRVEAERWKLYRAVECSPSSIVITDTKGTIEFVNPAFCRITGYSEPEAIGQNPRILKSGKHPPELYQEMWAAIAGGDIWQGQLINRRKDGSIYWEYVSIAPIKNAEGHITHYVGVKDDITALKCTETALLEANTRLQQLATADGLTQIANRRRFDEYLQQEWKRQVREQLPLALILCDIDFFKKYNDTYGHLAGDECLIQIAQVLQGAAKRPADLAARYGGEEFVIVLPNTDADGAMQVAGSIWAAVLDLKLPHTSSSVSPFVTVSIGVSCTIPMRDASPDTLILAADQALYDVKTSSRNAIRLNPMP